METTKQRKPKVLIAGPHPPPPGGMANFIANLEESSLRGNYRLLKFDTDYPRSIKGYRIFELIFLPVMYLKFLLMLLFNCPDLVHVHTPSYNSFFKHSMFVKLAKDRGIPVAMHIHGGRFRDFYEQSNERKKLNIVRLLNRPDLLIVLSQEWHQFFTQLVDSRSIRIVENGVPLDKFNPFDTENKTSKGKFLFIGEVKESKGVNDLLESFTSVIKKYPDAKLTVVGNGNLDRYKSICTEKGLTDNVRITGVLTGDELLDEYNDADIFVLPSYAEGMPLVLLEAMAMELACIASNVGAIPGILKPNGGVIIEPGDIKSLAKAMGNLIENPEITRSMGVFNRECVEREYSFQITADKIQKVYDDLITAE